MRDPARRTLAATPPGPAAADGGQAGPSRRRLLAAMVGGTAAAAAVVGLAPAFVRHARAADLPRFGLGIASGQPQATSVVLWTRLVGADLPAQADVAWELAEDEAFTRIAARGTELASWDDAYSVHAEPQGLQPARWYWYRFSALGQRSAVGRTRTAPAPDARVDRLEFAIASCQRYDVGRYAAWRHAAAQPLDLVLFLGDYIYEYPSAANAVRPVEGGRVRRLEEYRARYATHKSDPALQAAHAACPWLLVWDDHEVENDYAGLQGEFLEADFADQRAAAYKAYWEHMPLPKALRPDRGAMRMHGRLDWGRLARIHLLDDRQMRDSQVCPQRGRGGSNTVRLADCPALLDPRRTLLGPAQERWLADGWAPDRPWNLLAQQTLMARCSWEDPAGPSRGGTYWTDGWDGYPLARRRLLSAVAERKVPGVVVLGGDVHANYVANLRSDDDDPRSPVVAAEFCGTSITSLGLEQARLDRARAFNPHILHARSDQRGYGRFTLQPGQLHADLQVLADARDAASPIASQGRFVVEAGRPAVQRA
ncbi:MAG: alkaline phosphatase D family protein [Burkholderiales bacterium]|nr:alkaline phosphatase D family protein [Burkholderiales bacterium]